MKKKEVSEDRYKNALRLLQVNDDSDDESITKNYRNLIDYINERKKEYQNDDKIRREYENKIKYIDGAYEDIINYKKNQKNIL